MKLQIVSLSLQMAVFGETPVSPFLQIGIKVSANPVSPFLQIQYHRFCKSSITVSANLVSRILQTEYRGFVKSSTLICHKQTARLSALRERRLKPGR